MTTNIKQAAERLRRYESGEPVESVYPDIAMGIGPIADCTTLAYAYLAELDETPVDEEFAVKNALGEYSDGSPVGLCKHDSAGLSLAVFSDDGQFTLTLYHETGEWTFRGRGLRMFNPTRGQVRTACRLFGITLKEGI